MKILINGINLNSAGGRSLGRHLLAALDQESSTHQIVALVSNTSGLASQVSAQNVKLVEVARRGPRIVWRMLDDLYRIRDFCLRFRADVCFSLGDLGPLRLPCPHAVLVHNPWLLYDTTAIADKLTRQERLIYRRYYPWFFRRMCRTIAVATVQTPVMAERLLQAYPLAKSQVRVISSACTVRPDQQSPVSPPRAVTEHPHQVRLLFLAQFYPHKNHEILVPVLKELRRRKYSERFHFFLTISDDHPSAKKLLTRLGGFRSTVTNLGPLTPEQVRACLAGCHALFLPTLLETFGLVYLEAMACGTSVLTSDRDFSRYVCGDYAAYFEPTAPADIVDRLLAFAEQIPAEHVQKRRGAELLEHKFVSWNEVARSYLTMLESIVDSRAVNACPVGAP
jgi:glycosyltransferase involved in cell wall biosynthesis